MQEEPRNDARSRQGRASLAAMTLKILAAGHYDLPLGKRVTISLAPATSGTVLYTPKDALHVKTAAAALSTASDEEHKEAKKLAVHTRVEVVHESTLDSAHRLCVEEKLTRVCALNFASARHPGGGFLNGAAAQEESLARSSGLYSCLTLPTCEAFYRANVLNSDGMYTNHVIFSPQVPVFRRDDGSLLQAPYTVSMVTAPAVNAGVARRHLDRFACAAKIELAMSERCARVLSVAALHGQDTLILGAFGCGVFANSSKDVAQIFFKLLSGPFSNVFRRVCFSIFDQGENLDAFRRQFSHALVPLKRELGLGLQAAATETFGLGGSIESGARSSAAASSADRKESEWPALSRAHAKVHNPWAAVPGRNGQSQKSGSFGGRGRGRAASHQATAKAVAVEAKRIG